MKDSSFLLIVVRLRADLLALACAVAYASVTILDTKVLIRFLACGNYSIYLLILIRQKLMHKTLVFLFSFMYLSRVKNCRDFIHHFIPQFIFRWWYWIFLPHVQILLVTVIFFFGNDTWNTGCQLLPRLSMYQITWKKNSSRMV